MKTPEEKRWERMQQLLLAEAGGSAQPRISSTRTLFGIKSHVEEVVERVAAEDTARNIAKAHGEGPGDKLSDDNLSDDNLSDDKPSA